MVSSACALFDPDGKITASATAVLAHICRIDRTLLASATILPSSRNLLEVPWFSQSKGGGGMVIGRSIYFTSNWFRQGDGNTDFGNGTAYNTLRWLLLLSHEVGHLPQAARFGYGLVGRSRYLITFAIKYLWYYLRGRKPFTDFMPLEIEADLGRKTMVNLIFDAGEPYEEHPLVQALHQNDPSTAIRWMHDHTAQINAAQEQAGVWPEFRRSIDLDELPDHRA
jgi:hypothetical protein